MNRSKTFSKIMACVLALVMALSLAPMTALADVAGAAGPVGLPGSIAIGGENGNGSTASTNPTVVGFNGKLWQVIGYDGTGVASAALDMTLLLKDGNSSDYGTAKFNSTNNSYIDPDYGQLYLKMLAIHDALSEEEKALVKARDIDAKDNGTSTETVTGQSFWPLSTSEAESVNSEVLKLDRKDWWLRSPGSVSAFAAFVSDAGIVDTFGDDVAIIRTVRPAFNLNLSSVLFTSNAAADGAAGLSDLAAYTAPVGALKFTALDSTFSDSFVIAETAVSGAQGETVTLNYTGAATNAKNFIRVKLVNEAASGQMAYVAMPKQIAYMAVPVSNITEGDGSFTLTLPTGIPAGDYTAYAWVEQGNGANFTNQGGTPDIFTLTVNAAPQVGGGTYASNQIANNPQLAPQGSIYGGYGRFIISSTGFFRYFDPNNTLTANGSKLTVGQDYDVYDKGGYAMFEIYESTMQSLSGNVTFKATFTNGTSGSCTVNVGAAYVPAEINVNAPKTGDSPVSAIGFVLIAVVGLAAIAVKKVRA